MVKRGSRHVSKSLFPGGKGDGTDESVPLAVSRDPGFASLDIEETAEKVRLVSVLVDRFWQHDF